MGELYSPLIILEGAREATALIVDEDKGDLIGVIVDGKGEDICNNELRFSRACHTCHKAMGTVIFFVEVEVEGFAVGIHADGGLKSNCGIVFLPTGKGVQVVDLTDVEHFEEGQHTGQGVSSASQIKLDIGKILGQTLKSGFVYKLCLKEGVLSGDIVPGEDL